MKRISFFVIILCALLLAGFDVQAGPGSVTLKKVDGLFRNDTLKAGSNVRFVFNYNNAPPNGTTKACDVSNGFKVFSPDGAVWDSVKGMGLGTLVWFHDSAKYDPDMDTGIIDTVPTYSWFNPSFAITFSVVPKVSWSHTSEVYNPAGNVLGLLAAGAPRMTSTFNDSTWSFEVFFHNKDAAGKHLCIDSAFYGEGGTWVWVGANLVNYYPTWNGAPGRLTEITAQPADSAFCFYIYDIPNLYPEVQNAGATPPCKLFVDPDITQSHCVAFAYDFDACQPDEFIDPVTFSRTGPGTIDDETGMWGGTLATGVYTLTVKAHPDGDAVNVSVEATNAVPVINCPTLVTPVNVGVPDGSVEVTGTDADNCDPQNWSIVSISPSDLSTATIDGGVITFTPAAEGPYIVTVGLSDGIITQPVTCEVSYLSSALNFYGIQIEKRDTVMQGQFKKVDVNLLRIKETDGIGGFDILISYDNSAISLQSVDIDSSGLYKICDWEYFTYRFGASGNCGNACPSGLVRVVGLAETNNGAYHPGLKPLCINDYAPALPTVMFSLNFLVSNDRTLECQYVPIRFFWVDCGDNSVSNSDGSKLYIAGQVFDWAGDSEKPYVVNPDLATFPGFAGVPAGFCLGEDNKPAPGRNIDFYNGGIDIVCADSIDARGDINLNNVRYEIADAVMFTNYFVKGLSAFGTNPQRVQGSIAASDVNADGLALSVADLVYLIRVIVGDALPYPKTAPVQATYVNDNGTLSVDMPMGAAYVVIRGEVAPELLAQNMQISFGVREGNTHVIVYPSFNTTVTESFVGNFLNAKGEIISIEMATADGAPVVAKVLPAHFGLAQNYPNPFNPSAEISFSLPTASQYTLTVYNVTGQKVAEYSGTKEAGIHSITFNGDGMASGVYFYKLNAGDFSATKKMVLLK